MFTVQNKMCNKTRMAKIYLTDLFIKRFRFLITSNKFSIKSHELLKALYRLCFDEMVISEQQYLYIQEIGLSKGLDFSEVINKSTKGSE